MSESLRSRTFGDLFTLTFTVFFKCFGRLLAVQLLFWLPIVALVGVASAVVLAWGPFEAMEERRGATMMVTAMAAMVLGFAMVLLSPLPNAVSMIVIADHLLGQHTPLGTAFIVAFKKLLGFIVISLVYVLPWIVPAALMIIGGLLDGGGVLVGLGVFLMVVAFVVSVVFFVRFFVAGPVLVLEQTGPGAALRRSLALTSGYGWTIFGLFLLVSLIAGIAVSFITTPLNLFNVFVVKSEIGQLVGGLIGNALQQLLGGAFGGVLVVLLYFDLRVKKDGFDVENLAELVDVIAARESTPRTEAAENEAAPSP